MSVPDIYLLKCYVNVSERRCRDLNLTFFSNTSALLNAEVFLVLGVVHENCKH